MANGWMIYGANGYTGELMAEVAARRGLRPILAGRRREPIEALGQRLGLETRVFSLEDAAEHLGGVRALVLAAGPFARTARPAVDACLARGCHYLDITGEIDVFEALRGRGGEAIRAGIALLPGVGFDVVPSDCLAATLAARLPDARSLELAIGGGEMSPGTAKTVLLHVAGGTIVREGGALRTVPLGWKTRVVPFADKARNAVTISWGDVSTAHHSTGIPNIRVYAAASTKRVRQLRIARYAAPVLALGPVRRRIEARIERTVTGPDAEARAERSGQLWGRVADADGRAVEGTLTTPEPYALTAETAVEAGRRAAEAIEPGFHTPSTAFGADFIESFEGVTLRILG